MKALRSFAVRASLPESLEVLLHIATNLRWTWDPRAIELFRWIDLEAWERAEHDPVRLLGLIDKERFEELAQDGPFMSFLAQVAEDLSTYLDEPRWFQQRSDSPLNQIAYFSPEFGVSEALPIYSGGLGVLAGDHLKAASDLGVPLIGVGLFYKHGYFRQALDLEGWQQERYPDLDPYGMALSLCEGVEVTVELGDRPLTARVWRAD